LRRSVWLFWAGLVSEVVYLVVTVRLPWWRYGGSLHSWSQLLGGGGWGVAACLAGIGVVMAAYIWGWCVVRRGGGGRWLIWGFAVLFAGTLFWLMPITSDLFTYLSHAHLVTDLQVNPLLVAPLGLPADPLLQAYPAFYAANPSVYGPAWTLITVPGTLGRYDVAEGIFYLKGLTTIAYLGCAWLLEQILRQTRPSSAVEGLYLFAWNPLVLLMAVGDGHNDMAMMVLVLLAFWLVLRKQWTMAFAVLTLSIWIKYVSVIFLPLFAIYAWKQVASLRSAPSLRSGLTTGLADSEASRECGQSRWRVLARGALVTVVVSALVLVPFSNTGVVSGMVGRLLRPANWRGGAINLSTWAFGVGLLVFAMAYIGLTWRFVRKTGSFQQLANASFLATLLAFVLGAARSQPWHLIWLVALAGLSDRRWVWAVSAGLSAALLAAQVWVEWGAPGWGPL
jgi:hypothetical protein